MIGDRFLQVPFGDRAWVDLEVFQNITFLLFDFDSFMPSLVELVSPEDVRDPAKDPFQRWSSSVRVNLEMGHVFVHEFLDCTRAVRSRFSGRPSNSGWINPKRSIAHPCSVMRLAF